MLSPKYVPKNFWQESPTFTEKWVAVGSTLFEKKKKKQKSLSGPLEFKQDP